MGGLRRRLRGVTARVKGSDGHGPTLGPVEVAAILYGSAAGLGIVALALPIWPEARLPELWGLTGVAGLLAAGLWLARRSLPASPTVRGVLVVLGTSLVVGAAYAAGPRGDLAEATGWPA